MGIGTLQKTYANMGEALNDFWERRIIPTKNRHSAELGAQLLPLYGLDARDYRIAWDYGKVAVLQENEDQAHAQVRADYQAGLIDLYTAQTALGLASDESRRGVYCGDGSGGAVAAKMIDRQGKGHSETDGRYDGSGRSAAPSAGAFEDLHKWNGGTIAPESKEFQDGKARAFQKVLPYAKITSLNEASVTVLRRDGSEYHSDLGPRTHVNVGIPSNEEEEPVAVIHSHPEPVAHGPADWVTFLTKMNVVQSHAVAPNATYSLHKSEGWEMPSGLNRSSIVDSYYEAAVEVFNEAEERGVELNDGEERAEIEKVLANKYKIIRREGERR